MRFQIRSGDPLAFVKPLLAVPVTQLNGRIPRALKKFDDATGGQFAAALSDFTGKLGSQLLAYAPDLDGRILFVGLGDAGAVNAEALRRAAGRAGTQAQQLKCDKLAFVLPTRGQADVWAKAATEGVRLGGYVYNRYQTLDPKLDTLREVTMLTSASAAGTARRGLVQGAATGWGQIAVRDMVNTPASDWTPDIFASTARELGRECGFKVEVKRPAQLKKEGFGGILAVGKGSANTPRFIRMDYRHGRGKPVVLVGKGITFDTGGISLKPGADMDQMKGDMAGAAVVLSTIATVARLKLKINLIGLICTAENMPSSTAYRPGDVVTTYGGKTIEVLNTDAEGRIVLADGLSYAVKLDPRLVIDLATLTGAVIIALGHHTAGVLGNDQKLINLLLKSAQHTGEKLWQLPLDEEHSTLVKSNIADVKNTAGRPAATCTAAAFLKTFTGDHPWAHLDIAGVDLEFKGTDYVPKGSSGFGVRLLVDFLSRL